MLLPIEKILFGLLVAICLTATYNTFGQMGQIIMRGQGELNLKDLPQRIITGIIALLSQGRMIRHRKISSLFHYGVAYGFIFFLLVNLVDVLEGLIPNFQFLEGNIIGNLFRLLADVLGAIVIIGVLYFLLRRFAFQSKALVVRENVMQHPKVKDGSVRRDSLVVGLFILLHVGFRMYSTAFLIAAEGSDPWQPFANLIANVFLTGLSESGALFGWHASWWIAVGLIVMFLPYFPYTKHAHLFMGPLNFMTAPKRTYLGQMQTLDLEDESIEQFGVNSLFDLQKTQVLDAFACIMCNRCQEVCPAYNTGKELSPAALEINKRYYMKEHMAELAANGEADPIPVMDYAISESAIWACTACGHCIDVCPVGNAPMLDILDIRRDLAMMNSIFPEQLKGAFVGMERAGNPWQSPESRMAWAEPLPFNVPMVDENPDFDYLLWVGCAGAFNPDAQKVTRAVATILHEASISFAVLGDNEVCTGDSARRAGREDIYYELALTNIEALNEAGVDKKKIVTSCPHCFTALGKEYGDLGGHYDVFHHTQLIADLVGRGKLKLNGSKLEKVTFHDPCYLGRHNGVVAEPRDVLARAGVTLLEMDRNKKNSFCCGAGGAQYWKEEEHGSEAVNINRFEEAHKTGAETLAIGCPFCATMMIDANREKGEPMAVKDVAQLVVEAMN